MKKILLIGLLMFAGCGAGYAIMQSLDVQEKSGCCSRHGGVSYCGKSGYYVCADGSRSPSCRCR